jgi:hypothetical protein
MLKLFLTAFPGDLNCFEREMNFTFEEYDDIFHV